MSSLISNRLHSFQSFQKDYYTQELLHAKQLEQSIAQQKAAEVKAPTPTNTPRQPKENNRGSFQSPQPQQYNNDIHLPPARRQSQPKVKKPSKVKAQPKVVRFNKTPQYQSQSLNPAHYQSNSKNNTNMTDDDFNNEQEEEVHDYEDEDLNFESEDKEEEDEEEEALEEADQDLYDDNDEKEEMIKSLLQDSFSDIGVKAKKSKKRKTGNTNNSMQL